MVKSLKANEMEVAGDVVQILTFYRGQQPTLLTQRTLSKSTDACVLALVEFPSHGIPTLSIVRKRVVSLQRHYELNNCSFHASFYTNKVTFILEMYILLLLRRRWLLQREGLYIHPMDG